MSIDNIILVQIVNSYKETFLMLMQDVFGNDVAYNASTDRGYAKIHIRIDLTDVDSLLLRIQNRLLHEEIFTAITHGDFDGSKYTLNHEEFTINLYKRDSADNYQIFFEENQETKAKVNYYSLSSSCCYNRHESDGLYPHGFLSHPCHHCRKFRCIFTFAHIFCYLLCFIYLLFSTPAPLTNFASSQQNCLLFYGLISN